MNLHLHGSCNNFAWGVFALEKAQQNLSISFLTGSTSSVAHEKQVKQSEVVELSAIAAAD
jgi:hypothetical protein